MNEFNREFAIVIVLISCLFGATDFEAPQKSLTELVEMICYILKDVDYPFFQRLKIYQNCLLREFTVTLNPSALSLRRSTAQSRSLRTQTPL